MTKRKMMLETRRALAEYMRSEGCSCCQDYEGHKAAEERLAKLLHVKKYDDASGYNFGQYLKKSNKVKL